MEVIINYNINIKLRWLEGFVDGDGCVVRNGKTYGIQISSINKDFLTNILVAIETVDILRRGTRAAQGTNEFTGTALGFDKETQYNSIIDTGMGQIWFYREVNATVSVRVPIGSNTTLESTNEDKKTVIIVGDGSSVIITINQSG